MPRRAEPPAALHVVLLEDDVLLRERVLLPGLANYGFVATGMDTVAELERHLDTDPKTDLVVLDVGLPDADGFSVAGDLRRRFPGIGILMLTGRREIPDQIRGLSEGADAYLTKPVDIALLAATLHSVARRLQDLPSARHWHFDTNHWFLVSPRGCTVALTRAERRIVCRLFETQGTLVPREALIAALTDNVFDFNPHRLDSLISRLRRKVTETCGETLPLAAVHGEGYVLTPAS